MQVQALKIALRLAAELSAKYIQDRHLPDKAIDVIDETGAYVRLHAKMKTSNYHKKQGHRAHGVCNCQNTDTECIQG